MRAKGQRLDQDEEKKSPVIINQEGNHPEQIIFEGRNL